MFVLESRQRGLELQRFTDRFVHERLDDGLAPGSERSAAETAAEATNPREPDSVHFVRVAIQHAHAGIGEDAHDLLLLAGFEIVVSKDSDRRNLQR
jgi:hypothetical protein